MQLRLYLYFILLFGAIFLLIFEYLHIMKIEEVDFGNSISNINKEQLSFTNNSINIPVVLNTNTHTYTDRHNEYIIHLPYDNNYTGNIYLDYNYDSNAFSIINYGMLEYLCTYYKHIHSITIMLIGPDTANYYKWSNRIRYFLLKHLLI